MPSTCSSPAAGQRRSRRSTARLALPTSSVASAGVDTACMEFIPPLVHRTDMVFHCRSHKYYTYDMEIAFSLVSAEKLIERASADPAVAVGPFLPSHAIPFMLCSLSSRRPQPPSPLLLPPVFPSSPPLPL
jgi:hypothetical protein